MESAINAGAVKTGSDGRPVVDFAVVRQLSRIDCGAACLASVMDHWGRPVSVKAIERCLSSPGQNGYRLAQMQSYAQSNGFSAFLFTGTLDDLRKHTELGRPCIAVYRVNRRSNHAIVITAVITDGDAVSKIVAMDPGKSTVLTIEKDWFESRWSAVGSPILLIGKPKEGGSE